MIAGRHAFLMLVDILNMHFCTGPLIRESLQQLLYFPAEPELLIIRQGVVRLDALCKFLFVITGG